jgi:lon-related putative ATP-dependent protease
LLQREELRRTCDPALFPFETTAELDGLEGIVGQSRAVGAMNFGLGTNCPGYNIFIVGQPGTGRTTYALRAVKEKAARQPVPPDWCYVYNFSNPSQPRVLVLPGGKGRVFRRDIEDLEAALREGIPKSFDGEEYERQKARIIQDFQQVRTALLEELTLKAKERGFALKITNSGFLTVPIVDGREVAQDDYSGLDASVQRDIETRSQELRVEAADIMRRISQAERKLRARIRELDHSIGLSAVGHLIEELRQKYGDHPQVGEYLEAYKNDVLEHLDDFKAQEGEEQLPALLLAARRRDTLKYKVNLLVDNSEGQGAPVIYETNPTWYNLLGRVEYQNELGSFSTDFTKIRAGAFHRANGGYLILHATDLLANPLAWQALKRVLKTREILVESLADQYSSLALSTLRPEPVPLTTKVVLIGNPRLYQLLYHYDEDFKKLFKVKVDFNDDMERNGESEMQIARFAAQQAKGEGLRHFHRDAVARVVEYSSRLAANQDRLSTHFNELRELLYEADVWAGLDNAAVVARTHVNKAIAEKIHRSNRWQEYRERLLSEGKLLVSTRGEAVGQINGLSVLSSGDYQFGVPVRITANTFAGRGGIINIEREIELSGRIHSKGVLTLSGYLGQRFAQRRPLALSASITFEQLYGGVEGDSASGAELFALLSSLADLPLSQGIAVTGSVNQKGEIQPVGGINEKVEGWFETCALQGLTGTQGVIIPRRNVSDLMLNDEVLEAVSQGRFHVYAMDSVEQGLEILTGVPAGQADNRGEYPEHSIFGRVQARLDAYGKAQLKNAEADA